MAKFDQQSLFADDNSGDSPQTGHIIRVAIEDSAVEGMFDYLVPEKLWPVQKGQLLEVPFGRGNNSQRAVCLESNIERQFQKIKLKSITAIVEEKPILDDHLIELAQWISSYYICPIGQVLSAMVPSAVKKGIGMQTQKFVYLAKPVEEFPKAPKQKALLHLLTKLGAIDAESGIEQNQLLEQTDCTAAVLKTLGQKQFIKIATKKTLRTLPILPAGLVSAASENNITLNDDQQVALKHICSEMNNNTFSVSLLHGVTDSGKTEVYIRAIEQCIGKGKTAIILLPEIALTAQTVQRFSKRFENIAVMHSGLTAAQRNLQWQNINEGKANVIIGARSAIFAPVKNLGLVVVDEEHEPSYKQDTVPRYHGRDVAIKRSQLYNAHVILGSATPSLESLYNCLHRSHYKLLSMPKRVKNYHMPTMKLVDLKTSTGFNNPQAASLISDAMKTQLDITLSRGEQAILLLNRRGYSNYVFCPSCKHTLQCRNCDVSLTFHKSEKPSQNTNPDMFKTITGKHIAHGYAVCHYCLSRTLVPEKCPFCQTKMIMIGLGSQRLEEELAAKFPKANIARIDSDSMQAKDYYRVLEDFGSGKINILAGTQMLAKGLHFPNVTLVGIISADTSLTLPDFRANERTFQLICQVAGRAGRGEKAGTVIVQTFFADQAVIKFAMNNDFQNFVEDELRHRKAAGLPPFGRQAIIHLRDEKFDRLQHESAQLRQQIDLAVSALNIKINIQGPMPSAIARIHGFYRNQIILLADNPEPLQRLFARLRAQNMLQGRSKIAADIDPVNLL